MNSKQGIVICGFPGTGKRYALQRLKDICKVAYVDELEFKWIGTILKDFGLSYPKVYINQINNLRKSHDFILVSSDREIRDLLKAYNIEYHLVFPDISLKNEYIGRAYLNAYTDKYIQDIAIHWDSMIKNCITDPTPNKQVLQQHEYIGNYILKIFADKNE